jgi:hypothetical protein
MNSLPCDAQQVCHFWGGEQLRDGGFLRSAVVFLSVERFSTDDG